MIQVKKVTFTPADIFAMYVTPQLVLPAPPAGMVNNILGVTHDLVFNTLAYTGANSLRYFSNIAVDDTIITGLYELISIVNRNLPGKQTDGLYLPFSTTKNFYVTTDAQAATGDSNIDAYIIYEVVALD